jgi:hypothetical protein
VPLACMQAQVSSASIYVFNSKEVQQGGAVLACTMHYCVVAFSEQRSHNSIAHFITNCILLLSCVLPPLLSHPLQRAPKQLVATTCALTPPATQTKQRALPQQLSRMPTWAGQRQRIMMQMMRRQACLTSQVG